MYDKIKQIADNALAIQNKLGMEEALKSIGTICAEQIQQQEAAEAVPAGGLKAKPAAKKEGND